MDPFVFLILAVVIQVVSVVLTRMSKRAADEARRTYKAKRPESPGREVQPDTPPAASRPKTRPKRRIPEAAQIEPETVPKGRVAGAHGVSFAPNEVLKGVIMSEVLGRPKSVFAPPRLRIHGKR